MNKHLTEENAQMAYNTFKDLDIIYHWENAN